MTKPVSELSEEELREKREYFRLYAAKRLSDPAYRDKINARKRKRREKNKEEVRRKDREYKATRKEHFEAYDKKWKTKNRARYLANRKRWNDRNREELNAKAREYLEKNREKIRERQRNSVRHKEYIREYKAKNREEIRVKNLNYYYKQRDLMEADLTKRMRNIAFQARNRAKQNGYAFEEGCCDEFIANPPASCPCCGNDFDYNTKGKNPFGGPSLDKVHNHMGYVKGNVAIICRRCNTAKGDRTISDLIKIIEYMSRHVTRLKLVG